ncbi:TULIP family P47-like protein [Polymorphospora rubra]|uniref:TULIP family P47-like protein n=1 Tax=Polymorphospora rubra TaxID=338584 RepID=UPI0033F000ED
MISTYGWDTVDVVDVDEVNAALATAGSEVVEDFDIGYDGATAARAWGRFGAWRVASGGSGDLLDLTLPIASGTLWVRVRDDEYETDVSGVSVVLRVPLEIVDEQPSARTQGLRLALRQVGDGDGDVSVVTVLDRQGRLDPDDRARLGHLIATCLVERRAAVSFAFATIDLVPPHTDSWLAPVRSGHTLVRQGRSGRSFLAVLSVTGGRSTAGLDRHVDDAIIPGDGQRRGFAVSADLFLANVVAPVLPAAYGGGPGDYRLDPQTHSLRNRRDIATHPVTVGAITYTPVLTGLEVVAVADAVQTYVRGTCDLKAGITMSFEVIARNPLVFDPVTRDIAFAPDPRPSGTHQTKIPWYFFLLGLIAEEITELVVQQIARELANALNTLAGQGLTIARTPRAVRWAGAADLDVTTARLEGSLCLRGTVSRHPETAQRA